MNTKLLSDLADIKQGCSLRKGLETSTQGNIRVVKAKNVEHVSIDVDELEFAELDSIEDHILQSGDILLRTRNPIQASVFISNEQAIALSPITRIRLIDKSIDPFYLLWYFVSDQAQAYFEENMTGTIMQGVSVSQLKSMPIQILDSSLMEEIGDVYEHYTRYNQLTLKALELRKQEVFAILNQRLGDTNE